MIRRLARQRRWRILYLVLEAHDQMERQARGLINELQRRVTKCQSRGGMKSGSRFWITMLEGKVGVHANIIMTAPPKGIRYIERLTTSKVFTSRIKIQQVETDHDLKEVRDYCLKEASPQAWYGQSFRREKGSHPLGIGGGDRVRASGDLRQALIATGRIDDYRRSYAGRSLPAPVELPTTVMEIDPHGLFGLLAEQPAPERIARSRPRQRLPYPARFFGQHDLPIPSAGMLGNVDVLAEMRRLAHTHEILGSTVGRSRPQATNVLNRQFGASRAVVRRVLELVKAAA